MNFMAPSNRCFFDVCFYVQSRVLVGNKGAGLLHERVDEMICFPTGFQIKEAKL